MRVLFFNPNRSETCGGIEYWMLDVAEGLIARGHHAVVYGRRRGGLLAGAAARGLPRLVGFFGVDFHPVALGRLWASMRAHRIDVVFAKGKKGVRLAAAAARLRGHGSVVFVVGVEGEVQDRWVDRWTWRWAVDRTLVLAAEAKLWYERFPWACDGKLRVVLKGVDTARLDPGRLDGAGVRASLGIGRDEIVVGALGRLVWQKGLPLLLAAARRLQTALPRVRYLVVGAGADLPRLRADVRELGLMDRVLFAGHRSDVPEVLAAMDIVVLPSRKENMPQVLLEAMAMARPIVATACIGIREVLDDGTMGFVVPVGDVEALAERIGRLARDPELRATMGRRARARIEDGFTRDDMLARVEALLDEPGVVMPRRAATGGRRAADGPALETWTVRPVRQPDGGTMRPCRQEEER